MPCRDRWIGLTSHSPMNQNLWIAVIVAAVMVLAHVGVFWWFVCRGGKSSSDSTQPESPTDSTKRPDNP